RGLAAGFGAYVSLQILPAIVSVGLFLLVRRPRPLVGGGAGDAALSFASGAMPLAWMMSHVGTAVVPDRAGLHGFEALRQLVRPFLESSDLWTWAPTIATVAVIASARAK